MANVYSRVQKITDVVGRSDYISNSSRQENIVLHGQSMQYDWSFYREFEKNHRRSADENNEAREIVLALPNELEYDLPKLKRMCQDLAAKTIGKNHDYEYAVHWNEAGTNLHLHILFSEREVGTGEMVAQKYKRDIWMDRDTHVLAKAKAPNAELVHRKGEVVRDKDGKPKLIGEDLSAKDPKFKTKGWMLDVPYQIQSVFKQHGFEIDVFDLNGAYLPQAKIGVRASEIRKNNIEAENAIVREYNQSLDTGLEETNTDGQKVLIREAKEIRKEFKKARNKAEVEDGVITYENWLDPIQDAVESLAKVFESLRLNHLTRALVGEATAIWRNFAGRGNDLER